MNDNDPNQALAERRRLLLTTGGAVLALGAAAPAQAARPTTPAYAITSTRYSIAANTYLPAAGNTYILPLSVVISTDGNNDTTLNADNTLTINNAGNYRIMFSLDWAGGKGHDTAMRTYGIRLRPAGSPPFVTQPGELTQVPDTDQHLATQDFPGSDTPQTVRFPPPPLGSHTPPTPYPWTPGVIPVGSSATVDVTMQTTGIVGLGDIALAGLTSMTDAILGPNVMEALIMSAKVIAQDTVRVCIYNPSISPSVNIPQGDLQVLGMSATLTAGMSADALTVLSTVTVPLNAGDKIYTIFTSLTPGDYTQPTAETYVQVEKWTQTA